MGQSTLRVISPTDVRRIAIRRQYLEEKSTNVEMLDVVRDLGCLQLDPTSAVARSHLLVLWSRLGNYDRKNLDKLLWEERSLFEYWAHAASIVLTEDYPIHKYWMNAYGTSGSKWGQRMVKWVNDNSVLRDHIVEEIQKNGALPSKYFEDKSSAAWHSTGWTGNRNVSQMLGYLWEKGVIMVASRNGGHRYWDLSERVLPPWTPIEVLSSHEATHRAVPKSLRALGVATARQIAQHYTRSRYDELPSIMEELVTEGLIEQVQVKDGDSTWAGEWFIHQLDLPLLEQLQNGSWSGRTTLLSPFDNLICDRVRTVKLFNFDFRIEIYVPKDKRKYGYFVLPILHEDKLIGRIDPLMNRKQNRLEINAVFAEPDAPKSRKVGQSIAAAIESLATFLGVSEINYSENIPTIWKTALRNS